jgi:hypothetical protein
MLADPEVFVLAEITSLAALADLRFGPNGRHKPAHPNSDRNFNESMDRHHPGSLRVRDQHDDRQGDRGEPESASAKAQTGANQPQQKYTGSENQHVRSEIGRQRSAPAAAPSAVPARRCQELASAAPSVDCIMIIAVMAAQYASGKCRAAWRP